MTIEKYFSRKFKMETTHDQMFFCNTQKYFNHAYHPPLKKECNQIKPNGISKQQSKILEQLENGKNVLIDAVFGSGKTTSIIEICKYFPKKKIIILTYNAKLKLETRNRLKNLKLKNAEVYTYHALAVKYYSIKGKNDVGLEMIVKNKEKYPLQGDINLDIIILDEVQDMNILYYSFANQFIKDVNSKNIQIALFGDKFQNIYSYKGSDSRFLTFGDLIYKSISDRKWTKKNLSVSFRTNNPMKSFINTYLVGYDRVVSTRDGPPVRYLLTDSFSEIPFLEIKSYLEMGFKPDDIYVLVPSLRAAKSPARILENRLTKEGISCYVPTSDNEQLNDNLLGGKVVFSSFHQVKGSERPVVLVFNFDESYYKFYGKNESKYICPNAIYVALSRSKHHLTLIHHYENNFFPLLDNNGNLLLSLEKLQRDVNVDLFRNMSLSLNRYPSEDKKSFIVDLPVTELLRHLNSTILKKCLEYFDVIQVQKSNINIDIPSEVKTKNGLIENVADINGIAIPLYYELCCQGKSTILDQIITLQQTLPDIHLQKILNIRKRIAKKIINISDILYLSNIYHSIKSGYISKREQITKFNWVTSEVLKKTNSLLNKYINSNAKYEYSLESILLGRNIVGVFDIFQLNKDTNQVEILELKCTKQLEASHFIQLAVYGWLYSKKYENTIPKLKILNCLNGGLYDIKIKKPLDLMMEYIVKSKYNSEQVRISDSEFLSNCSKIGINESNTLEDNSFQANNKCMIEDD